MTERMGLGGIGRRRSGGGLVLGTWAGEGEADEILPKTISPQNRDSRLSE